MRPPARKDVPSAAGMARARLRTQGELDRVIGWLIGFDEPILHVHLSRGTTFRGFFAEAPSTATRA